VCLWQVSALEQRCQKLEVEVQKLAQTWSEAAPTEEIKVRFNLFCRVHSEQVKCSRLPRQKQPKNGGLGCFWRLALHLLLDNKTTQAQPSVFYCSSMIMHKVGSQKMGFWAVFGALHCTSY